MASIKILSARQIDTLPDGFHADGGNLYLKVKGNARSWVFRYKQDGKVREIGMGATHTRTLADAREKAALMRQAVADGTDPAHVIRVKPDAEAMTFKARALALIEAKRPGWRNVKHAKQWVTTLEQYAYPVIGHKLPADVSLADVKAILLPIWATKTETATRLRQRIEAVLDYAAVHEDSDRRNPARWRGHLDKVLPAANKVRTRVHFPAAPYLDVPRIMSALRDKTFVSAYCLRFTILTAARSGETRGALWSEIDLDAKVWTIPASRMKAGKEHRVPLCAEAVEILNTMQPWKQPVNDRIFPGERGGLLSDVALNKTLRTVADGVTVHGFRSSFRDWGAEQTSIPRAVMEAALAHSNQDKTEAAYMRSDLFERRVELMNAWGRYCAGAGNVVRLVSAA
ncbi:MAG: tyrosine-type recombinase/integrase [Sulfuriferula sp.]